MFTFDKINESLYVICYMLNLHQIEEVAFFICDKCSQAEIISHHRRSFIRWLKKNLQQEDRMDM